MFGIFPAGKDTSNTGPIIWVIRPILFVSVETLIFSILFSINFFVLSSFFFFSAFSCFLLKKKQKKSDKWFQN
jgi:positive regulator of sigma E activity